MYLISISSEEAGDALQARAVLHAVAKVGLASIPEPDHVLLPTQTNQIIV